MAFDEQVRAQSEPSVLPQRMSPSARLKQPQPASQVASHRAQVPLLQLGVAPVPHVPHWSVPPQLFGAVPHEISRSEQVIGMQVGQHGVAVLHPLSLNVPSGMIVLQKMAPPRLTELPSFAPDESAPTKHVPPRLAAWKSALVASAPVKLLLLRLAPRTFRFRKSVVAEKSHREELAPRPGVQRVPG